MLTSLRKTAAVGVLGAILMFGAAEAVFALSLPALNPCLAPSSTNLRYRSTDQATNGEVTLLQSFLRSKNYLNSEPTGYFGVLTLKAVKDFQTTNGISPTGFVGPLTKAAIQKASCGNIVPTPDCPEGALFNSRTGARCSNPSSAAISYLSPSSGAVNTSVTIRGTGLSNAKYVKFGNGYISDFKIALTGILMPGDSQYHSAITFTVPSGLPACPPPPPGGVSCLGFFQVSPGTYSVSVITSDGQTSNAVNFTVTSTTTQPSITVTAPNGGETWTTGSSQKIAWNFNPGNNRYFAANTFDITLIPYTAPCPPGAYCVQGMRAPYAIAKSVPDQPYTWTVGTTPDGQSVPAGRYTIRVCVSGDSSICDATYASVNIAAE